MSKMFLSDTNCSLHSVREFYPGGLFTDLSMYLYGGTIADLSKIPQILRGIVIYCPGKNDQLKKVGD